MEKVNINNKEYKEIYDKNNNLILRIKRPVWISDDTVNICHGCRQFFSPFRRKVYIIWSFYCENFKYIYIFFKKKFMEFLKN